MHTLHPQRLGLGAVFDLVFGLRGLWVDMEVGVTRVPRLDRSSEIHGNIRHFSGCIAVSLMSLGLSE